MPTKIVRDSITIKELEETGEDFIEFDSMINVKPAFGNRSRGVDNPEIREKIREIATKLIDKS